MSNDTDTATTGPSAKSAASTRPSRAPMFRVSLRNLAAHKLRLALTVIAVVLGTSFIAGALVFTATLEKTFDGVVSGQYENVDVIVEPEDSDGAGLGADTVEQILALPEVRAVQQVPSSNTVIYTDADGERVQTGGSSATAIEWTDGEYVGPAPEIVEGSFPDSPEEVAVNDHAVEQAGLSPGDEITVVSSQGRAEVTVSGIFSIESTSGASTIAMSQEQWQDFYTDNGLTPRLSVAAAEGYTPDEVASAISSDISGLDARTAEDRADEETSQIAEALGFLNYFLIAFGLIGLLTGAFIISNTFAMLVAQRMKEFALLRAIGASRRQITRSVLGEATLVGIIGSVIGVVTGFGLVVGLLAIIGAMGMGLPATGVSWSWSAVIIPLIAGIAVTILGAWAPASRAGKIPPVAAMRSGDATSNSSLTGRNSFGSICLAAAVALGSWGVSATMESTGLRASMVGAAAALSIIGAWLIGPLLAGLVAGNIGRLIGLPFGTTGRLAATNSRRNPRRTASTAFALTLGLALVTSVGMLGSTMKGAVDSWVDESFRADLVVSSAPGSGMNLPNGTREAVNDADNVEDTAGFSIVMGNLITGDEIGDMAQGMSPEELEQSLVATAPDEADGSDEDIAEAAQSGAASGAGGPGGESSDDGESGGGGILGNLVPAFDGDMSFWFSADAVEGSIDLTDPDAGVVLERSAANDRGLSLGSTVYLATNSGLFETSVTGIHSDPTQPLLVSTSVFNEEGVDLSDVLIPAEIYVSVTGGIGSGAEGEALDEAIAAGKDSVSEAVSGFLVPQVLDRTEYAAMATDGIDAMLSIVYGLLALAVVISVLGILNTLALSVIERRQEIGMLRAVAMQRKNVRRMIILESVQISIFGALVGAVLGLAFGWAFLTVLAEEGLDTIVVPWNLLATTLIGSGFVGILAALWPAAKAAKTPPLAAIAED